MSAALEVSPVALPTINSVWIGRELGAVHVACLRSFLRQGHKVVLHCYAPPHDVPIGVEIADASSLIPEAQIARYLEGGHFALISDLLRYEIAGNGLYVDCDVFCLRPIENADYIFGLGHNYGIQNAVLKLPQDCPALANLRAIKNSPVFRPPWQKAKRVGWLRVGGEAKPLEELKWGTIGPGALSYYAKQHGLMQYAAPIARFYPVHWTCTSMFLDPSLSLKDVVTSRTDALHLYHNSWKTSSIPEGSPLWEIARS